MYQHGFQDLDGHLWELVYMDVSASPELSRIRSHPSPSRKEIP